MGDLARASVARTSRAGTATLIAAIVGSSLGYIDGTAVNVALPIMQRDLNATSAQLQWVVEGYSLFLSALLLIGGSLGDIFGRKRVFGIGVALFAVASLGCALSTSMEMLIAARCIQGIGGALMTPGSLALISANFDGEARGRAIGTWSGFSAITTAAGPLLGGWLTQTVSWRAVFVINLPLAVIVMLALAAVPESRDDSAPQRVDLGGGALATLGLGALVYGLITLQNGQLDWGGIAWTCVGIAGLVAFWFVERGEKYPMVQLSLFRSQTFTVANLYTLLLYAALGGSFYFVPFDLINVQGYSPAAAGAVMLPFILIMFAFSRFSGGLVVRVGARRPMTLGAILAAFGFVLFASVGIGRSYWLSFFPAAIVLGLGGACFVAPLTTTVMNAVPSEHAGVASGINNAVSRAAGLLAIAVLGIVLALTFDGALERSLARGKPLTVATRAALVREHSAILAGNVPADIPPVDRAEVGSAIASAFHRGYEVAMLSGAALAALAAILAWLRLPDRLKA